MNTEKSIEFMKIQRNMYFPNQEGVKSCNGVIELLQRGEVCKMIIDKMKNEKYDVWVSLPGSFINLPEFVKDVEKEVIK